MRRCHVLRRGDLHNACQHHCGLVVGLIKKAMEASPVNKFLIDGFPRALDQADAFEGTVCKSAAMLFLDCPEEVMEVFCQKASQHLHIAA